MCASCCSKAGEGTPGHYEKITFSVCETCVMLILVLVLHHASTPDLACALLADLELCPSMRAAVHIASCMVYGDERWLVVCGG